MERESFGVIQRQRIPCSRVGRAALVLLLWLPLVVGAAEPAAPADLLTDKDRALLEKLGPGVVGKPVPSPSEAELAKALVRPRASRFRIVAGSHAGRTVEVVTQVAQTLPDGTAVKKPTWTLEIPGLMTQYLRLEDAGLNAAALLLRKSGFFSEYAPIEPLLIFDLAPGESRSYSTKVAARHVSKPDKVAYNGELKVTYRNLGAYEVKTPAGTFPGLVIRCDYVGTIGPAQLTDTDLRIYAPGVGLIALAVEDRFHAFLLLNKTIVDALILEEVSS